MAMPKKKDYQKRLNKVRIGLTNSEYEIYTSARGRLLSSSPSLKSLDILRKCALRVDDNALLQFLSLDPLDPLIQRLQYDYLMSQLTNKDD